MGHGWRIPINPRFLVTHIQTTVTFYISQKLNIPKHKCFQFGYYTRICKQAFSILYSNKVICKKTRREPKRKRLRLAGFSHNTVLNRSTILVNGTVDMAVNKKLKTMDALILQSVLRIFHVRLRCRFVSFRDNLILLQTKVKHRRWNWNPETHYEYHSSILFAQRRLTIKSLELSNSAGERDYYLLVSLLVTEFSSLIIRCWQGDLSTERNFSGP